MDDKNPDEVRSCQAMIYTDNSYTFYHEQRPSRLCNCPELDTGSNNTLFFLTLSKMLLSCLVLKLVAKNIPGRSRFACRVMDDDKGAGHPVGDDPCYVAHG